MPVSVFSDLEKCAQVGEVTLEAVCICIQKPERIIVMVGMMRVNQE